MHGRLKVRSTDEDKKRKLIERSLKVKAYKSAMEKILLKRGQGEFDDELMQLIQPLLLRNPDISALWNMRRHYMLHKLKALVHDSKEQQEICAQELKFTEVCLMTNPKSYCGWHQRSWVLQQNQSPLWEKELQLCNNYLKLDERNFHTWDYRRHVIAKGKFDLNNELDFCTNRIKINFSNYSSWHYRSILLPIIYPIESKIDKNYIFHEDILKKELDMVLTATFTDPNDSSAWFYQRWLLGSPHIATSVVGFRCNSTKAIIAFSKSLSANESPLLVDEQNENCLIKFTTCFVSDESVANTIWSVDLPGAFKFAYRDNHHYLKIKISGNYSELVLQPLQAGFFYIAPPQDTFRFSISIVDELKKQLHSCEDLIKYEPENKWTLLTTICILRSIDRQGNNQKALEHLRTLKKVDPLRTGYYNDLASKWILQKTFDNWVHSKDFPHVIDLSGESELHAVLYTQYFSIVNKLILPPHMKNYLKAGRQIPTFDTLNAVNLDPRDYQIASSLCKF